MTTNKMLKKGALLVFAKPPIAGQVKTRLIPDIGAEAATNLYKELLTLTLNTANQTNNLEKQLWLTDNCKHVFFEQFNTKNTFELLQQKGKDLGERMFNAFEHALNDYNYAVLIGCDCPGLTEEDLTAAANMLESDKDIVLGPAEDGGYYLIGLKRNNAKLFSDITWGSSHVFSKTISRAEGLNLNIGLLETRTDIDRVSDLKSYEKIKNQECSV